MTRKLDLLLPLEASCERGWVDLPFPIPARFTLRSAGDMRDPVARNRVLAAMDLEPRRVVMVRQVHSRVVVDARMLVGSDSTSASEDRVEADGIVCAADGPVIAVGVGDCAPIYVADLRTGAYALVHSGWRGTGILRSAVESMYDRFGSRPSDLVVTIGPCISGEAYVVDDERARAYLEWGGNAVVTRGARSHLDMRAANLGIARELGIRTVSVANHCTFESPLLGSFRREGAREYTGMLAMLGSDLRRKADTGVAL